MEQRPEWMHKQGKEERLLTDSGWNLRVGQSGTDECPSVLKRRGDNKPAPEIRTKEREKEGMRRMKEVIWDGTAVCQSGTADECQ